jgi:hypothetical protein
LEKPLLRPGSRTIFKNLVADPVPHSAKMLDQDLQRENVEIEAAELKKRVSDI